MLDVHDMRNEGWCYVYANLYLLLLLLCLAYLPYLARLPPQPHSALRPSTPSSLGSLLNHPTPTRLAMTTNLTRLPDSFNLTRLPEPRTPPAERHHTGPPVTTSCECPALALPPSIRFVISRWPSKQSWLRCPCIAGLGDRRPRCRGVRGGLLVCGCQLNFSHVQLETAPAYARSGPSPPQRVPLQRCFKLPLTSSSGTDCFPHHH